MATSVSPETVNLFLGFIVEAFGELSSYQRQILSGIAVDPDDVRATCDGLIESIECYQLATGRVPKES